MCCIQIETIMSKTNSPSKNFDKKRALVMYIMELFTQIDELSSLKKSGHAAKLSTYILKETASVLEELDEETRELYFELLVLLGSRRDKTRLPAISEEYVEALTESRRNFLKDIRAQLAA